MPGLSSLTNSNLSRSAPVAPAPERRAETQERPSGSTESRGFGEGVGINASVNQGKPVVDDQTAAKFGDVWKKIQAEYGAKAEKPREVKKSLGKDDFMRLMIHQMKNQDPTSPFKAEQMAQQMAQYASVEQLSNMNAQIGKLTTANQPLERLAMTGLIGKTVTVSKERFVYTQGQNQELNYSLPKTASSVKVTVVSATGEPIFSKDLGPQKQGSNTFVWDGLQGNTMAAKTGNYTYKITAQDESGSPMQLPTTAQSRVVGVSFDGAEPVLLVGDPASPDKIPMSSVSRIADEESVLIPGARSLASVTAPAAPSAQSVANPSTPMNMAGVSPLGAEAIAEQARAGAPTDPHAAALDLYHKKTADRSGETPRAATSDRAFFTFEKGKGSKNLDPSQLPPEQRAALMRNAQQAYGEADSQKGFPNGINESSEGGQQ